MVTYGNSCPHGPQDHCRCPVSWLSRDQGFPLSWRQQTHCSPIPDNPLIRDSHDVRTEMSALPRPILVTITEDLPIRFRTQVAHSYNVPESQTDPFVNRWCTRCMPPPPPICPSWRDVGMACSQMTVMKQCPWEVTTVIGWVPSIGTLCCLHHDIGAGVSYMLPHVPCSIYCSFQPCSLYCTLTWFPHIPFPTHCSSPGCPMFCFSIQYVPF